MRDVASGGGRFGPGRLDGERAEEAAVLRRPGVSWRLGERPGTRVRVRRCQEAARWRWEVSLGPFGRGHAVDEVHRRRTAGGGKTEHRGEREVKVRAYL